MVLHTMQHFLSQKWIEEDEKYEESPEYMYNQLPLKSTNSLVQQAKEKMISAFAYIFD